ncbi:MAG: polyribonucleotide nucleotidyltransferase, partial [Myxococcota bacterium]
MDIHSVSVDIGGKTIIIETGKYAKQAHGSVTIRQGDSIVLCTATAGHTPTRFDFMPLTVEYMDRTAAYGKIPGGFFKREGRANERETLVSRLIDRPIRPLFPKTWRYETQVIATVMSYDADNETDVLSIAGASAALHVSDIPAKQSCAGVRISRVEGQFVVNPTRDQMEDAELNLVVAGTSEAVCMVEGGGKEVSESVMMDALDLAHGEIKKLCAAIDQLRAKSGEKAKRSVPAAPEADAALVEKVKSIATPAVRAAMAIAGKHERRDAMAAAKVAAAAAATAG